MMRRVYTFLAKIYQYLVTANSVILSHPFDDVGESSCDGLPFSVLFVNQPCRNVQVDIVENQHSHGREHHYPTVLDKGHTNRNHPGGFCKI